MFQKYAQHMQNKSTHERRQHALKVAGIVTAVLFVGWLATLGMRLSMGTGGTVANSSDTSSDNSSQLANVVEGASYTSVNSLQVASTTGEQ
jgi:hypothetical protein